jgi:NADPH-dependent curcumin reductase CurA
MDRSAAALADLQSWVASGKLKVQERRDRRNRDHAESPIGLLAGENRGKRMVRV